MSARWRRSAIVASALLTMVVGDECAREGGDSAVTGQLAQTLIDESTPFTRLE